MSETELMPCAWAVIDNETGHVSALYKTPTKAVALSFQSLVPLYRRSPVAEGGGWRTIDSAPKDGTRLLLWYASPRHPSSHRAATGYWDKSSMGWDIGPSVVDSITHWQPLPSPPVPSQEGASNTGEQK